jgi:hypothetical protein
VRDLELFVNCIVLKGFKLYQVVSDCFKVVVEVLVGVGVDVIKGVDVVQNFIFGLLIYFYLVGVYNVCAL